MDRNQVAVQFDTLSALSLSARRAWIEIKVVTASDWASVVALRKESVDRNFGGASARPLVAVALRKESVDRNTNFNPASLFDLRRSPQGERG